MGLDLGSGEGSRALPGERCRSWRVPLGASEPRTSLALRNSHHREEAKLPAAGSGISPSPGSGRRGGSGAAAGTGGPSGLGLCREGGTPPLCVPHPQHGRGSPRG